MNNKQFFDQQFKFAINQEVRHKGDIKGGLRSDMGILVLRRSLEEHSDDDGNVHFTRNYICRLIRFSGSGDLGQFKESELLTMKEYNQKVVEEEQEREDMRNLAYETKKEVFQSFGVHRNRSVYLKVNGVVDTQNVYKVCGYARGKDGTVLLLRKEAGEGKTADEARVKSKDEFELVPGTA